MNTNDFQLQKSFARIVKGPQQPTLAGFDPNEARSMATQHRFRLTFQSWNCFLIVETEVGGNCEGFDNLDAAISNVYEALPENAHGEPYLMLSNENGDSMEVQENHRGEYPLDEETLKTMLVRAEIVALAPREAKAA